MVTLITTDQWQTRTSAIFHGIFENEVIAIDTAKKNNLYNCQTCVIIEEITINEFKSSTI